MKAIVVGAGIMELGRAWELARTIATDRDPLQHARWAAGREGE